MILFLNAVWSNFVMLLLWLLFFVITFAWARRNGGRRYYLVPLGTTLMMFYFLWAMSDLWSTHEVATAFNRTAQALMIACWSMVFLRFK